MLVALGWLNHSQFEPFDDMFFHFFHVPILNLELFDKDLFFGFQPDLMQVGSASSQVESIFADSFVELQ